MVTLFVATATTKAQKPEAEAAVAKAEQLRANGDEESSRQAIESYKQAIASWKEAGNKTEQAHTLKRIGDIFRSFNELNDALAYYQQALTLYRSTRNLHGECETLNQITSVYAWLGDKRALSTYLKTIDLARSIGDRSAEAQALSNRGEIYYWSGKLTEASEYYRRALRLWVELKDARGQADSYTSLGYTASDLAQVKEAFDFYRQALDLWKASGDQQREAITFTALGRLYSRVGESQEALDFFDKAERILSRSGNKLENAAIFTGKAFVYSNVGEEQKAIDYYGRAQSLFKAANYLNGQAVALYNLGRVYYSLGDNSKAHDAQSQALEICRMTGDRRFQMIVRIELGRLFDADGNRRAAIKNYVLAQSFARSQKDLRTEMDTWNLLGISYEAEGKSQSALDCYKQALALSRKAESRYGESATLYQIAHAQFNLGDLTAARKQAGDAISLIESLRAKVSSQELRASYFASVRQLYELYIDVLMELHAKDPNGGYDVLAFEASERGRARSLLEMLATARVGVREKVDSELLARERELRAQLSRKAEQSFAISSGREGERAQVDRELEELTSQYQEVRAQIRAASLEHTDQTQPRPLGLQQIRERDFADDTALLEFSLGERRSYGWFVTKDSFKSWSLPPRHEIEESAIAIRNLLTQPAALPGESFETTQNRAQQAEDEYWRKAAGFSKTLLRPVVDDLGTKRLLIVPDGALQYIPFGALPIPSQTNDVVPLIVQHEISLEPSASILATLRGRHTNPPAKALAVFADPVFELNDSRFTARPKDLIAEVPAPARQVQMERALRDVNSWSSGRIPRLLASREEADAITSLTSASDNLKAVGFDANKAAATSLDLSQYRIIHIATHGVLDSRNPELSGLLLSRFDQEGRPREGFLRLDDIYNLGLSASMVVLSACNTGLGKDVRGEGLVGLVHGFMYAGTSRVVASLWKVDDDATAELMTHFYREMFQSGKSPVAALRAAQIAMWQQKRWHAPYYWAAFVLHGDYEGRVDGGRKPRYLSGWQVGGVVAFAMAAGFFFWRRKIRKRHHAH